MYKIYIDGGVGTTGLQIHQRLADQPDIQVLALPEEQRKSLPHRLEMIDEADLSILCLPDDAAREIAAAAPSGARLCDASTAHRTSPEWVYGLAELEGQRERLRGAARVAVPGCHATGFISLVAPLVQRGLLPKSTLLQCHSLTGYSGGGKKMIAEYENPARTAGFSAPRQYGLGMAHKHLPEMQAVPGLASPPTFCPIVADYYSGMLVSVPLGTDLLPTGASTPQALANFYTEYYAGQPLISVKIAADTSADGMLAANEMAERDDLELWVLGNESQILLAARFDNLGKGASGAAVQCMNLMLGRDELCGLRLP